MKKVIHKVLKFNETTCPLGSNPQRCGYYHDRKCYFTLPASGEGRPDVG